MGNKNATITQIDNLIEVPIHVYDDGELKQTFKISVSYKSDKN